MWIIYFPGIVLNISNSISSFPGFAVWAIRRQRVPLIDDCKNPCWQRDRLTLQSFGISKPVPALVMAVRNSNGWLKKTLAAHAHTRGRARNQPRARQARKTPETTRKNSPDSAGRRDRRKPLGRATKNKKTNRWPISSVLMAQLTADPVRFACNRKNFPIHQSYGFVEVLIF